MIVLQLAPWAGERPIQSIQCRAEHDRGVPAQSTTSLTRLPSQRAGSFQKRQENPSCWSRGDLAECNQQAVSDEDLVQFARSRDASMSALPTCTVVEAATYGRWVHTGVDESVPGVWAPWECTLPAFAEVRHRVRGKHLLLFGDSQGTHLAGRFAGALGCALRNASRFPVCRHILRSSETLRAFFGEPKTTKFTCVTCSGCANRQFSCPGGGSITAVVAERFEQTSVTTNRSNTTLSWLLREWAPRHKIDLVIGNIGLHELHRIAEKRTFVPFAQSAIRFMELVSEWKSTGREFIFMVTT